MAICAIAFIEQKLLPNGHHVIIIIMVYGASVNKQFIEENTSSRCQQEPEQNFLFTFQCIGQPLPGYRKIPHQQRYNLRMVMAINIEPGGTSYDSLT